MPPSRKIFIRKIADKYINNAIMIMAKNTTCRHWHEYIKIESLKTQPYSWVVLDLNPYPEVWIDDDVYRIDIPQIKACLKPLT